MLKSTSYQDQNRPSLLSSGAFICAFGLLSGRWSPARLLGYEYGEAPFYLDIRLCVIALGVIILSQLSHLRIREPRMSEQFLLSMLFLCAALVAFTITSMFVSIPCSGTYCLGKSFDIIYLVIYILMFYLYAKKPGFEDYFWKWVFVIALVLAVIGISNVFSSLGPGHSGLTVLSGGRNVYSRILGVLGILALFYYKYAIRNIARIFFASILGVAGMLLLLTGSRGGTMASVIGVLVALRLFRIRLGRTVGIIFVVSCLVALCFKMGLFNTFLPYVADRYIYRIFENFYFSGRDDLFEQAIALWKDYPLLGVGLGRFDALTSSLYPHNFFLEILTEFGLVGFTMFAVPLLVMIWSIVWDWAFIDPRGVAVFSCYIVAAQVSGDIFDSRMVILAPIIVACGSQVRKMQGLESSGQLQTGRAPGTQSDPCLFAAN